MFFIREMVDLKLSILLKKSPLVDYNSLKNKINSSFPQLWKRLLINL